MTVDESSLTGESLPVEKRAGEALLGGSAVKTGEVDAIIDSTGKNTFMGQSAHLMNKAQPRGHFEKILLSIALCLVAVAIVLVIVIFCHSLTISGVSISGMLSRLITLSDHDAADNIQLCMVVLVASIPIALPVVATSTMAVGAQRLAQHNAVVSRLAAIEELAGMDILCSDKTGNTALMYGVL